MLHREKKDIKGGRKGASVNSAPLNSIYTWKSPDKHLTALGNAGDIYLAQNNGTFYAV
jgi:hypothetical protein